MIGISNLSMSYRSGHSAHPAVNGISLQARQGSFYTLLGPSGCGKTSLLRCVAGLEQPDEGEIAIGGETVYSSQRNIFVPPHRRRIGMVFQSYAIWPHMTVFENVAFPLRHMRPRPGKAEIKERVLAALALVKLAGLEERPAPFLSGGQQQRLALARALVAEPRVLLLDEPLSNLDAKLREEMRLEIRQMVERLGVTTLFVTHEQIEALTMSDVMAVMKDGQIVQEGPPETIYREPSEVFVADFIGSSNFLRGELRAADGDKAPGFAQVATPIGTIECRLERGLAGGETVSVAIRPEHIVLLGAADGPGVNRFDGAVETVTFLGNRYDCRIAIGSERLRVQLPPTARIETGAHVRVELPPEQCLALRP
ncbi:MAG TPA: ABC transporter ATP-binding protein [Stellaceae bacterium]|nr:ABC transporter ATP-binding protein [Stellaceae bacterium]